MIDWDDLRIFLAVSRAGTLARAGSALGINATTVGRRLEKLEETAGARLFDRTPEGYALTRAGHELLPRAERMESEALSLERSISGADRKAAGLVRLSVTEMLGTRFIAPHLPRFHQRHPEILLDLSCTNRSVQLARREADIALRLAQPREENLVVKKLTAIDLGLYAAKGYLERAGRPPGLADRLDGHDVIFFADARPFAVENEWLSGRLGRGRIVMRSDSVSAIFSATVAGLGIGLLPVIVGNAEPSLERIASEDAPEPRVVWQAVHRDLARATRIRAVLDFLGEIVVPATRARAKKRAAPSGR
ncbi:MAG: LysR family transcriptional regulator [Polyangiaceae bacterium]|nr:LysR family transcriptional regulator [Polyangiaceae bacterium]MCE7889486.1 LysR family transcriptional regulator [Sorangiineae bacterium PRO1]MCL4750901.1 LysR family transcriptional regulator [Myxococcales bacterium]